MFFRKKFDHNAVYDWLIVGLGNPGKKYEFTRHNAGFLCLDYFAQQQHVKIDRLKFKSLLGEVRISGKRCLLMKPQTYMNLSGEAVGKAVRYYHLDPEKDVLVVYDDLDLQVGMSDMSEQGNWSQENSLRLVLPPFNEKRHRK